MSTSRVRNRPSLERLSSDEEYTALLERGLAARRSLLIGADGVRRIPLLQTFGKRRAERRMNRDRRRSVSEELRERVESLQEENSKLRLKSAVATSIVKENSSGEGAERMVDSKEQRLLLKLQAYKKEVQRLSALQSPSQAAGVQAEDAAAENANLRKRCAWLENQLEEKEILIQTLRKQILFERSGGDDVMDADEPGTGYVAEFKKLLWPTL